MSFIKPQKVGGQYLFTENRNYEDYSSGRVLYGATGATNFPVRLVSEIFQRAKYILTEQSNVGPYTIYDPFCGAGYSLAVLGLLHSQDIETIYASDVNEEILEVAEKNLSLLTKKGLAKRIKELHSLYDSFHKNSHKEALESSERISKSIQNTGIKHQVYTHDALNNDKFNFNLSSVDLIITDLPYEKLAKWQGIKPNANPAQQFLNNIKKHVSPKTIITISINKKQEITHEGFTKIKSFKIGTRKMLFLQLI